MPKLHSEKTLAQRLAALRDCPLGKCAKCGGPIVERTWSDGRRPELACHYCGKAAN